MPTYRHAEMPTYTHRDAYTQTHRDTYTHTHTDAYPPLPPPLHGFSLVSPQESRILVTGNKRRERSQQRIMGSFPPATKHWCTVPFRLSLKQKWQYAHRVWRGYTKVRAICSSWGHSCSEAAPERWSCFGSQLEGTQSARTRAARQQEHRAGAHIASTEHWRSAFFSFKFGPGSQPMKWCHPHRPCVFPSQMTESKTLSLDRPRSLGLHWL